LSSITIRIKLIPSSFFVGVKHFPFMTVFNWGESPNGRWKLLVETKSKDIDEPNKGEINYFSLVFYGHKKQNSEENKSKRFADTNQANKAFLASSDQIRKIYDAELKLSRETRITKNKRLLNEHEKK
jgi:subtilisin-like proprotein convertase family protein